MTRALLLTILLATSLHAQARATFSPRDYKTGAAWTIAACAPPGTATLAIPAGRIYQIFVEHGIDHDDYDQAVVDIDSTEARSAPAVVARWTGYAAAAVAFLMTVDTIKANKSWLTGATTASGALNVVIPLAQGSRHSSQVDAIKRKLLRDTDILAASGGSCAVAVVIGARGKAFEALLP
jgi:hypothetical protein